MVVSSERLERYRRDPKCWPCCRCKRNGQHKNQRFNATSLSSDKIKKILLLLLLCHLIVIPRLFFVVFPTAAFYLSALLSNDVVWSAKKYVETSHLSPRSSLYISSAVASVQMARRFSSFFGCSPWFLAHILNLKSKIKTKKIDWYSRTESKISSPWARFTYLKTRLHIFCCW